MSARPWKQYADGLKAPVHVTIEYETWGGSPGAWSRWTEGPDLQAALWDAADHVRKFKRVDRIHGGSASPHT